jgi:hypothetical protein
MATQEKLIQAQMEVQAEMLKTFEVALKTMSSMSDILIQLNFTNPHQVQIFYDILNGTVKGMESFQKGFAAYAESFGMTMIDRV